MYAKLNNEWKIDFLSPSFVKGSIKFTEEEIKKLENGFSYINWELVSSEEWDIFIEAEAVKEINFSFSIEVQSVFKDFTPEEVQAFFLEVNEAAVYRATWSSSFITAMLVEWETEEELVSEIETNAEFFKLAYANSKKKKREKTKALKNK